jgi:hypothetical protein
MWFILLIVFGGFFRFGCPPVSRADGGNVDKLMAYRPSLAQRLGNFFNPRLK